MKLAFLGVGLVGLTTAIAAQTGVAQAPASVKILGCLQGDGSEEKPWVIAGVALPAAPAATAAAGGAGAGGGGRGGGGRGGGAPAPPAGAGAAAGAAGARGGAGRGTGGAAPPTAAAPAAAPSVPLVDLRVIGGLNMSPWRNMKVEVEGTLGAKPASGLQELRASAARSVQGVCTPK
jgi:hypothetical protein